MYWLDRQIIRRIAQPLVNLCKGSSTTTIARFLVVGDMTSVVATLVAHFILCGGIGWMLAIEAAGLIPVLAGLYYIAPFLSKKTDTPLNVFQRGVMLTWFVGGSIFFAGAYYFDHSIDVIGVLQHLGFGLMTATYYVLACKQPPEKRRRRVQRMAFSEG
jgi:hypothetical protein